MLICSVCICYRLEGLAEMITPPSWRICKSSKSHQISRNESAYYEYMRSIQKYEVRWATAENWKEITVKYGNLCIEPFHPHRLTFKKKAATRSWDEVMSFSDSPRSSDCWDVFRSICKSYWIDGTILNHHDECATSRTLWYLFHSMQTEKLTHEPTLLPSILEKFSAISGRSPKVPYEWVAQMRPRWITKLA